MSPPAASLRRAQAWELPGWPARPENARHRPKAAGPDGSGPGPSASSTTVVVVSTARVVGAAPASVPSVTVLDVVEPSVAAGSTTVVALSAVVLSAVAVVVVVSGGS